MLNRYVVTKGGEWVASIYAEKFVPHSIGGNFYVGQTVVGSVDTVHHKVEAAGHLFRSAKDSGPLKVVKLFINGEEEVSLSLDHTGKHHFISGGRLEDVHSVCRKILSIIDDLPIGIDFSDLPPSLR